LFALKLKDERVSCEKYQFIFTNLTNNGLFILAQNKYGSGISATHTVQNEFLCSSIAKEKNVFLRVNAINLI